MHRSAKIKVASLVLLAIMMLSAPKELYAVSLQAYNKIKTTDKFKTYINGVGEGMSWANSMLTIKKQPPLYCSPPTETMDENDYINIIDREIKRTSRTRKIDPNKPSAVEMILLFGLVVEYPCR